MIDWENRSASIADAKKAIPKLKKAAGINIRIYSPKPVEQAERRSMYLPSDERIAAYAICIPNVPERRTEYP